MSSLTFMVKVLNKPMVPLVGVMTGLLWISVLVVSFGINTSCTNAWSCTSSNCQPCRIVGFASLGGLLVGTAIGAGALFAPFPRFGRRIIYVTSMITLIICIAIIAGSWSQPQ
jgi:hypothetical protein